MGSVGALRFTHWVAEMGQVAKRKVSGGPRGRVVSWGRLSHAAQGRTSDPPGREGIYRVS